MNIDKLIEQRNKLNARIQKEKAKEGIKKRKLDTRAKILAGSVALRLINQGDNELLKRIEQGLNEKDRERFIYCLKNR